MLEFLGLTDEAFEVVISCVIMGLALGAQLGALSAYKKSTDQKATTGQIVFLVICILVGGIGFLVGILPAILLFFTFQWAAILAALFQGGIVVFLAYLIARHIVLNIRIKKYMKNPITVEAVKFCKEHDIVGIQCFIDRLRFFNKLEDPDYCNPSIRTIRRETEAQASQAEAEWERPSAAAAYDRPDSYMGTLTFSERGYPNLPDLPVFARALAKSLGFGHAEHRHSILYDTVRYSGNTRYVTHNTVRLMYDCFVFSRAAKLKKDLAWKKPKKAPKVKKPEPIEKPTTWE